MYLFVPLYAESGANPLITDDVAESARLRVHTVEATRMFFRWPPTLFADCRQTPWLYTHKRTLMMLWIYFKPSVQI